MTVTNRPPPRWMRSRFAAREFRDAVVAVYVPWACEPCGEEVVDAKAWVAENCPQWLVDSKPPGGV